MFGGNKTGQNVFKTVYKVNQSCPYCRSNGTDVHTVKHFDTNFEYVSIVTIVIGCELENQGTVVQFPRM